MDLDDPRSYETLDPSGMGRLIYGLPAQCRDAWQKTRDFAFPAYRELRRIVVLGMGGSAIAGDLVGDLQAFDGAAHVRVHRGYAALAELDAHTLVVASSYSGNTEETLAAFGAALDQGAKAIAVTTGGSMAVLAESRRVPIVPIEIDCQPRASLGWGFCSLLAIVRAYGLGPPRDQDLSDAIGEMASLAEAINPSVPLAKNPAKRLAKAIGDRLVLIVGAGHLQSVARRWKTQLAENAKSWAFADVIPEMNHNAVEGVAFPEDAASRLFVVLLRSTLYPAVIAKRFGYTAELFQRAGIVPEQPEARSDTALAQILTTVLVGDYVSYYVAVSRGVDPTTVPNLNWLKARMAKG